MTPTIHRGDLYWLCDHEPGRSTSGIAHPHVVVSEDVFNHSRVTTVIVCALSSNLSRMKEPGNALLDPGEGGLEKVSVVLVSQVSSVPKAMLGARIGSLSAERVDQVLAGLRFQQTSFFR